MKGIGERMTSRLKKSSFLILLLIALVLILSGCTKNYDRKDIQKYVQENIGIRDFTVSSTRQEITNQEDGYTDYLWTVKEKDGTIFHVLDDYYYASEWVSNSLRNDWNAVHLQAYLKTADHKGFEVEEDNDEILYVRLMGAFTSRAQLRGLTETLNRLAKGLSGVSIPYLLEYDFPGKFIGDYEINDADSSGTLDPGERIDPAEAEKNYLHFIIDMRDEKALSEFKDQEIHDLVKGNPWELCVLQEDESVLIYRDLLGSRFAYGISFPTLYEILVRNDYPVTGTKDDFTFEGIDGNTYEMSNAFIEDDWHYYLVNDEKTQMDAYFYNHLRPNEITELTGIRVDYARDHTGADE